MRVIIFILYFFMYLWKIIFYKVLKIDYKSKLIYIAKKYSLKNYLLWINRHCDWTKYRDILYIHHSSESDLVLLREWWCSEEQDQMRKIQRKENTRFKSVTKMMRKEDAAFVRNREPFPGFCCRSEEWRSLSASRSVSTNSH